MTELREGSHNYEQRLQAIGTKDGFERIHDISARRERNWRIASKLTWLAPLLTAAVLVSPNVKGKLSLDADLGIVTASAYAAFPVWLYSSSREQANRRKKRGAAKEVVGLAEEYRLDLKPTVRLTIEQMAPAGK